MTQAAAEKEADAVNAASGGQNLAAGPETMFHSPKGTVLGIFERPS